MARSKTTTTKWVVPCYFSQENFRTTPILFDLTAHLKLMLKNEVWERKYNYGFNTGLKNTDPTHIRKATIKIYPRFFSGIVNEKRISEFVGEECGNIPTWFDVDSYKKWSYQIGLAIIETEYDQSVKMPSKANLTARFPNYDVDFIGIYHQHLAVLKELSAFFLAVLHLSFPTHSIIIRTENPLNDGFVQMRCGRQIYCAKVATNNFMHEILIETSKKSNIEVNLNGVASVWHFDLWPLKRYLNAVESDQISMDNLLDLIYSLEGLYGKNTSSDFVKISCMVMMCNTRKDARKLKALLDLAYRIRNDIAHGERSYDTYDYVTLDGKEILAQTVYWEMKTVVACMLIKAISKLIKNEDMRNLRFNTDDFINLSFKA